MLKVLTRTAAIAAIASLPFGASALGISVTETTKIVTDAQDDFTTQLGKLAYFTIEDFERFNATDNFGQSNFIDRAIGTNVGSMTFSGAAGTGNEADGDKSFGRIENTATAGRKNTSKEGFGGDGITEGTHTQYLESNDVQTMTWAVSDTIENRAFDRLLFSITDAADNKATFTIKDGDDNSTVYSLTGGEDGQIRNFVVSFATLQTSAEIIFTNMNTNVSNDGVGFDNMVVGAVPLPAAAWLLMGVSGALVGAKRRSARKAA
jgi:hypothetical protein